MAKSSNLWTRTNILTLFIIVEHLLIALQSTLSFLIPEVPDSVIKQEITRRTLLRKAAKECDKVKNGKSGKSGPHNKKMKAGSISKDSNDLEDDLERDQEHEQNDTLDDEREESDELSSWMFSNSDFSSDGEMGWGADEGAPPDHDDSTRNMNWRRQAVHI